MNATMSDATNPIKPEQLSSYKAWLQYGALNNKKYVDKVKAMCSNLVLLETTACIEAAKEELLEGLTSILGSKPNVLEQAGPVPAIVLGTAEHAPSYGLNLEHVRTEGYFMKTQQNQILLFGKTDKGVLYAAFHLLRIIQMEKELDQLFIVENPVNELRMINQWDNIDASIERGYAGESIFYKNNQVTDSLSRIKDYARLLSSVGINAISINNVNVHEIETRFIMADFLPEIEKVASIFRTYGIRTFLSINYASPMQIGQLDTADPLEPAVKQWWQERVKEIYQSIPDFGGFLVKADSEHRPGPFTYGRDHAEGANVLAEALEPYNGLVIWRCFVYNCLQDWRDRTTDRARAAYDHFKPLDGKFLNNVVLQIKNGPMDFQVREPVSPLFGALTSTNQVMEFQITQEYTGQKRHVCYLVPQWKEVLDFDTYAKGEGSSVKAVVDGSLFGLKHSGIAAVSNIGADYNWTGHTLAQANLYGYGRLIWNPELSTEQITEEWIHLTFGSEPIVHKQVNNILLSSWNIYEKYTSPLGVGWMVNPGHHYGPNVDGYEYSVWGTYHFADRQGIGVNRTEKDGTGYTAQYHQPNADMYESLESCPDDLLLFFHHVPYTHRLKSGETVIQHIYNTHFEGADQAEELINAWKTLEGTIDRVRYRDVLARLEEQSNHAKEWRDIINTYFFRKSGFADEAGRAIY